MKELTIVCDIFKWILFKKKFMHSHWNQLLNSLGPKDSFMLKSMLVNKDFQTNLIGWQRSNHPFRSNVWKSLFTTTNFNIGDVY